MKLSKSPAGMVLLILYYVVFLLADVCFMMFVILKTGSFLAGLGVCLALSVGIGILGGELEYQMHRRELYKKYFSWQKAEEPKKIIAFPLKSSDAEEP
jgi:hypothetical protein